MFQRIQSAHVIIGIRMLLLESGRDIMIQRTLVSIHAIEIGQIAVIEGKIADQQSIAYLGVLSIFQKRHLLVRPVSDKPILDDLSGHCGVGVLQKRIVTSKGAELDETVVRIDRVGTGISGSSLIALWSWTIKQYRNGDLAKEPF